MRKIIMLLTLVLLLVAGGAFAESISGKVVETMNSGGYTYINLDNNGTNTWVAVPQTNIASGEEMTFSGGAVMRNFTSKTLNRTFDTIVFSAGPVNGGGASSDPHGSMPKASAPAEIVNVEKASGENAYVVAELYEKSAELDQKSVVVRGQVVKVSESIMGKNWIHLKDGSGDAAKGTDDIIVTTQDLPAVGDVVIATGTLYKDKDFGSGYKYSVIVEEGTIQK